MIPRDEEETPPGGSYSQVIRAPLAPPYEHSKPVQREQPYELKMQSVPPPPIPTPEQSRSHDWIAWAVQMIAEHTKEIHAQSVVLTRLDEQRINDAKALAEAKQNLKELRDSQVNDKVEGLKTQVVITSTALNREHTENLDDSRYRTRLVIKTILAVIGFVLMTGAAYILGAHH